jgi:thiamine biosynthesis lipoprotein
MGPESFTLLFDAIGTRWEIETGEPLGREAQAAVLNRVAAFDATYSRFRPDSLVARLAAASDGGRFEFPDDSIALFDLYDRLHSATDGAVDPLVGRDLELLGYDGAYSLTPAPRAEQDAVRVAGRLSWARDVVREGTSLVTRRPLVIDVGAAGKGYLIDIVCELLRDAGFAHFLVDGSGDLRRSGGSGLRVGLEDPRAAGLVIGVAHLGDQALCASATNRRVWGDGLHHVLDGRTGMPVRGVTATWVVADDAATADGLATALFFTTGERLAEQFRFTHVRMFDDGRAERSRDFNGELFS